MNKMAKFSEPTINVKFADLISKYGLIANPETIKKNKRPDIILNLNGLIVIIEGKFEENEKQLKKDIKEKISEGLANLIIGVVYPENVRYAQDIHDLEKKLLLERFKCIIGYFKQDGLTFEEFNSLTLNNIIEILNNIVHLYIQNNLVQSHVSNVDQVIKSIVDDALEVGLFFNSEKVLNSLRKTLGIVEKDENQK